ncbi:MAG: cyclodeaminase/cyclohydrolase family protein [Thermacetogeniaceae bacterium]|nr:cyclodeaminase/cyclohydrolase family protein [Syntrophomonadaceae bacterium]
MDTPPVIKELKLSQYFRELSADSLYPSAGSSAGVTAAHAAALFAMTCRVNLRRIKEEKGSQQQKDSLNPQNYWEETLLRAETLMERALALAQEDGFAIKAFFEGTPLAAKKFTDIPLEIARCAGEIISLIKHSLPQSYPPVKADMECARWLAEGSKKAALMVAQYNIPYLKEEEKQYYVNQIEELSAPPIPSHP